MTTHRLDKQPVPVCALLPPMAAAALVAAGKDMDAINAAHRYAMAMHPEYFQMDDLSYAVKVPKAGD